MRQEGHHGSGKPARLPSKEASREQGDTSRNSMAPENRRSFAQERLGDPLHSTLLQDDYSPPGNLETLRRSSSSQISISESTTAQSSYTKFPTRGSLSQYITEECRLPQITLPPCLHDHEICHLLQQATTMPPVTPETLRELDLQWIQNNINLRVDVHYDYDLHFMPISGQRGEEKRTEAQIFWRALEIEMRVHHHNCLGPCAKCSWKPAGTTVFTFNQRLPAMFSNLEALLLILVPNNEHRRVSDALDVNLLMQQIEKGVLDVVRLSRWLSDLLTTHCAPIRDEWAYEMTSKISEGVQQNDMSSMVAGLEKLFSFCEAMKLDVANHQIRTFRLPLIEDGVPFQRDYFRTRMRLGKLDPRLSLQWFGKMYQECLQVGLTNSDYTPIVYGLVWLVVRAKEGVPELLRYDSSRILQLREEISDLFHLDICWEYLNSRLNGPYDLAQMRRFKRRILDLTDGECTQAAGSDQIWDIHLDTISAEITRAIFAALDAPTDSIPARAFAKYHKDLGALFHQTECRLQKLAEELQEGVHKHLSIFQQLSALQISEIQQQYQHSRQNSGDGRHVPDIDDIARRLAHMAVIHWRVWSDLYIHAMESMAIGVSGGDLPSSSLAEYKETEDNGLSDTPFRSL